MRLFLVALAALLPSTILACEDATGGGASTDVGDVDAGSPTDAGHGGHDSAAEGSSAPPIRCTEEELAAGDITDGGTLEIRFEKVGSPKQYENRCATVKAGASVTFTGSFAQHPLEPAGGDSPNPIPYTATDQPDDRLVVTLPAAGTFGFQCEFHPTLMYGAIRVVP